MYKFASRREGTKELRRPQFLENLRYLFPELETMPHGDTVNNVLKEIDVEQIQEEMVHLISQLIRNKKFQRYLVQQCYFIAIDGLIAFSREYNINDHGVKKNHKSKGKENENEHYYVYIVESYLVFPNGLRIPLYK